SSEGARREVARVLDEAEGRSGQLSALELPKQTPLFHAEHSERYQRQEWIRRYQDAYNCRLIVVIDVIFGHSVAVLEELIHDADPDEDLHLLLYAWR
ncbi:MAG TPA: hypothetical protein VFV02_17760, partial [Acidimicrobiales bacterium]|nr:hypothetical protein [Acidimicrobiales bacterium]